MFPVPFTRFRNKTYDKCVFPPCQPLENLGSRFTHTIINTLKSSTEVYDYRTHYTDSEDRNTMAPCGRKLYYLPLLVLAVSSTTLDMPPYKHMKAQARTISRGYVNITGSITPTGQ